MRNLMDWPPERKTNGAALNIEHIITADDPFGEPWPPDGSCSIVRRARGFTLWRRLPPPLRAPDIAANGPRSSWRHSKRQ